MKHPWRLALLFALGACNLLTPSERGAIRGSTQLCSTPGGSNCTLTAGDDPPGDPITVTASGPEHRTVLVTQSSGNPWMIDRLPAGLYRLDARYPDFRSGNRLCKVWWDTHKVEVIPPDTVTVSLKGMMLCLGDDEKTALSPEVQ